MLRSWFCVFRTPTDRNTVVFKELIYPDYGHTYTRILCTCRSVYYLIFPSECNNNYVQRLGTRVYACRVLNYAKIYINIITQRLKFVRITQCHPIGNKLLLLVRVGVVWVTVKAGCVNLPAWSLYSKDFFQLRIFSTPCHIQLYPETKDIRVNISQKYEVLLLLCFLFK